MKKHFTPTMPQRLLDLTVKQLKLMVLFLYRQTPFIHQQVSLLKGLRLKPKCYEKHRSYFERGRTNIQKRCETTCLLSDMIILLQ